MRRWNWQDARGMTLVELMLVLAIFTIVMGAVASVLLSSLQAYWKGDQNTQIQQSGRVALDRLNRDFRQARRLCISAPTCGTQGGFGFTVNGGVVGCAGNPQISFVLPHFGNVTLSDNTTQIWMTDAKPAAPNQGQIPYDGSYVSYYLAASANAWSSADSTTWPNASGPYLKKTVWDITGSALSTVTVVSNITAMTLTAGGSCPVAASREMTVALTASIPVSGQPVPPSSEVVTTDIYLRNPALPAP